MHVSEAIDEFQREHKARGSTSRTVKWYGETLRRLLKDSLSEGVEALTPFTLSRALNVAGERGIRQPPLRTTTGPYVALQRGYRGLNSSHATR